MRNNFFLFALLLLVLSCNKIPFTPTPDVIEEEKEVFKVFHSHFAENTKTVYSFATNGALLADWEKNDRAGVYQTSSNDGQISASTRANKKPLAAVQNGPHSDFSGKPQDTNNHYVAIYPFIENATESYIITQRLQNQIQSGNDNISHLSNHYVYKTSPFTYNDDDIEWNNNVLTTLKIEVPGSSLPIEEVSVRGPWGLKSYSVKFEHPLLASQYGEKITAYIVVPDGADVNKLYISVHTSTHREGADACYEYNLKSKIAAGQYYIINAVNANEITYPYDGEYNGHRYVKIGEVKWSTCAVGACFPWEHGDLFRWGAKTSNDNSSDWDDGLYSRDEDYARLKSWNDAATYNFGSNWCTPTKKQIELSLFRSSNNVTQEDYTLAGVSGTRYIVSDKKWIFIPNETYWTATAYYRDDQEYNRDWWAYSFQFSNNFGAEERLYARRTSYNNGI